MLEARPGTPKHRLGANLSALDLALDIAASGTPATDEEKETLRAWTGWGALPQLFDPKSPSHDVSMQVGLAILKTLVEDRGVDEARRSTINAHYTDAGFAGPMWQAVRELGFEQGLVLEPGCGRGKFFDQAPEGARMLGVELDSSTAMVARALHPEARVLSESFADTNLSEGSVDLVMGNVPFGAIRLHDPRHNRSNHSIHNHFLVKSMHLLKPGGVMAVVTSRYTMDSKNPAARRELAQLGEFLGAARLPTGAHRKAAGTDVVTDVLLFRKTLGAQIPSPRFEFSVEPEGLSGLSINEYFVAHPENVLGAMALTQGEAGRPELAVVGELDASDNLSEALRGIVNRALSQGQRWEASTEQAVELPVVDTSRPDRPIGFIWEQDGEFRVQTEAGPSPHKVPQSQVEELRALLALRDTSLALLDLEAAEAVDTPAHHELRDRLNKTYDSYVEAHGPINRFKLRKTGRVNDEGEPIMARIKPGRGGFAGDPFCSAVEALEDFEPVHQVGRKAAIMRERVLLPRQRALGAETAEDALALSLDECGKVDLARIAELLGQSEDEARRNLSDRVFDDPESGELQPAGEYLSGFVRKKLRAAERAALDDPRYAANIAALRRVQPTDLGPGDIKVSLGAAWIESKYVEAFLQETLDDSTLRVEHGFGSIWSVKTKLAGTVASRSTWGTEEMPAAAIAKNLLEQRPLRVMTKDSEGNAYFNPTATAAAVEKAAQLSERFSSWVWEDAGRAEKLCAQYNEQFNGYVGRDYSEMRLSLPGLATSFRPHPHQMAVVAQSLHEPALGIFHEVGAGKTAAMVMSVMEKRRLGLVQKPVIVVPNHMLAQFTKEFYELYPQARILAAGREDLEKSKRRLFVAKCATNHWDAVIMTRSAFERIPVSPQVQVDYEEAQSAGLKAALDSAEEEGQRFTTKRMEAMLARREQKVKALLDSVKDPGLTFEQLGIDHIVADEAHAYKNMMTASTIPSMAIEGSQRATDMDQKLWYLRHVKKVSKPLCFATATPISNSISEFYTMARFIRPDLLEQAGIHSLDQWAATFGRLSTGIEVAPDGTSLRMKTRFANFHNLPELRQLWAPFANVMTAEDLALPVPMLAEREADGQRGAETVVVEPSFQLVTFVGELAERASAVTSGRVEQDEDCMLAITTAGRLAALDLRLVRDRDWDLHEDLPPQKVDVAAGRIAQIFQRTRDNTYLDTEGKPHPVPGALQIVFSDLGTPNDDGRWNVYDALRDKLEERGVPRDRIRFIHEAKTDRDKHALFTACKDGQVSVLIGSTEKMGVGTNVQRRAVALHHLDCPWRPADIAQREGRILRQGNQNPEVQILRYVTERSFDSYLWQTVSRKSGFVGQVIRPRGRDREIDGDISESALSYDEVKALATGNPLLLAHAKARAEVERLENLERGHTSQVRFLASSASKAVERIAHHEQALARYQEADGKLEADFSLEVAGQRFGPKDKRGDAERALRTAILQNASLARRNGIVDVGKFRGLTIQAVGDPHPQAVAPKIQLREVPAAPLAVEGEGTSQKLLQRLANVVGRLGEFKEVSASEIEKLKAESKRAKAALEKGFPQKAELAEARVTLQKLDAQMHEEAAPELEVDAEVRWNQLVAEETNKVREHAKKAQANLATRHESVVTRGRSLRARLEQDGLRGAVRRVLGREQAHPAADPELQRLRSTVRRIERHAKHVACLVEELDRPTTVRDPAVAVAEARVARRNPELARAAREAEEKREREAATQQARPRAAPRVAAVEQEGHCR